MSIILPFNFTPQNTITSPRPNPAVTVNTAIVSNPIISHTAAINMQTLIGTIEARKEYERNLLQANNIISIASRLPTMEHRGESVKSIAPVNSDAVFNRVASVVGKLYPVTTLADGSVNKKPLPLPELNGKIMLTIDKDTIRGSSIEAADAPNKNNWIIPLSFIAIIIAVFIK